MCHCPLKTFFALCIQLMILVRNYFLDCFQFVNWFLCSLMWLTKGKGCQIFSLWWGSIFSCFYCALRFLDFIVSVPFGCILFDCQTSTSITALLFGLSIFLYHYCHRNVCHFPHFHHFSLIIISMSSPTPLLEIIWIIFHSSVPP